MENPTCPCCKIAILESTLICSNCQFPFNGTEKEKSIHIGRFISSKGVLTDSDDSISKSQKILSVITALNTIFLIIGITKGNYMILDIILNGFITLIFLLCAIFIKKMPLVLTCIPLFLVISINILNYFIDPISILSGIAMKLVIIISLGYSVYLIVQAKKFQKQFKIVP